MYLRSTSFRKLIKGIGRECGSAVLYRSAKAIFINGDPWQVSYCVKSNFILAIVPSGKGTPPCVVPVCTLILLIPFIPFPLVGNVLFYIHPWMPESCCASFVYVLYSGIAEDKGYGYRDASAGQTSFSTYLQRCRTRLCEWQMPGGKNDLWVNGWGQEGNLKICNKNLILLMRLNCFKI